MDVEYEAKFLDINHEAIREKLTELGAVQVQPMRLMRRKNFDFPSKKLEKEQNGWVRVRDEGDKITLAYKELSNRTIEGTKEVSVAVDGFDNTCQLLENIGLIQTSYQETKRESWELDGVQIELDEWPWIPTFIEIEASNAEKVGNIASKLGLDMSHATHGSVEVAYMQVYNVTEEEIDNWPEILFIPVPDRLEKLKK
jgi:adenylate cyclase class 2